MDRFHHLTVAIDEWRRRRNYRSELRRLLNTGDHLLRDAGISRETAMTEVLKASWRS